MGDTLRNVINFQEIEALLNSYREKFKNFPLMLVFVNHNLKNFLYREAPVVEDFNFATAVWDLDVLKKIQAKGGPFHRVVLSPYLLSFLDERVKDSFFKVALGEVQTSDQVTSICQLRMDMEKVPFSEVTYIKNGYKVFHLMNLLSVREAGEVMRNCLRYKTQDAFDDSSTRFYLVEDRNNNKVAVFSLFLGEISEFVAKNNLRVKDKEVVGIVREFKDFNKDHRLTKELNMKSFDDVLFSLYFPFLWVLFKSAGVFGALGTISMVFQYKFLHQIFNFSLNFVAGAGVMVFAHMVVFILFKRFYFKDQAVRVRRFL